MKLWCLASITKNVKGYSLHDAKKAILFLNNNNKEQQFIPESLSHISMIKRDVISMPSQRPMVPYMPRGSQFAQFIDIEAAMYRDRTMMINTFIDDQAANNIISIMLYLRNESPRDKISMYFNVPGASLRPALAIYDLIQNTKQKCTIETVNLALCAGMGAMLCSAGTKGKRSAMPNARFLLYRTGMEQVYQGQATDIALEVKNIKLWNDRMENELSMLTGQQLDTIQHDLKRDFYLTSDEAVQYGLIDRVLLPSVRKRAARGQEADLGTFEGELEQRYQNQKNQGTNGGWGNRREQDTGSNRNNNNDDEEPKIMKG